MPVRLRALDRWRRSVLIRNHLGTAELWMTVSTKRSIYGHRSPTASPLAMSFQTPELHLQVAIGQLLRQETEQRTEQPGLFQ